jgi:hypothetical protein
MHAASWDSSADDLDDREYPDVDDMEGDGSDTVACPECGAEVYEDADRCPVCGLYIVHHTHFWAGRSAWWIVLAVLGIVAVLLTLTLGL